MAEATVGRIVHVVANSGALLAAIVTKVNEDKTVNAVVFDNGDYDVTTGTVEMRRSISEGDGKTANTWNWPEGSPSAEPKYGKLGGPKPDQSLPESPRPEPKK